MMHEWGFGYGFTMGPLGMLILAALLVIPFSRICQKAGFPGIVALLVFVPVINIIFLYWLAFVDWPNQRTAASSSSHHGGSDHG